MNQSKEMIYVTETDLLVQCDLSLKSHLRMNSPKCTSQSIYVDINIANNVVLWTFLFPHVTSSYGHGNDVVFPVTKSKFDGFERL